jgi:transposase
MDNAKIFHSKESFKANFDRKIRILYNPPYSPILNPVEKFYSVLKKKLIITLF